MVKTTTLAELLHDLESLMVEHAVAEKRCREAESDMTSVRNRINEKQRAIDKLIEETRKIAPWNTDWHSRHNPGFAVESNG